MKLLSALILVCLMNSAIARDCKVYGISDSPQKLTCQFGAETVRLSCQEGTYYLNQSKVNLAFHLEVEDGAVPLVFRTSDFELTVIIQSKVDIQAELVRGRLTRNGQCF